MAVTNRQELEKSLGAPLFERMGKQVMLTHSGRMLLEEAPPLLQQADNLRERFREISQGISGELRIGFDRSSGDD